MRGRRRESDGFSLVEVIIAMLLIGLIAVALLPALWQGITLSSQQSATATATRHLYALVEDARAVPTCATLSTITAAASIPDGKGTSISIAGTYDPSTCDQGEVATVILTATAVSGLQIARVDAQGYIP